MLHSSTELHAKNLSSSNELVSFSEYVLGFFFLKETIPHQYPLVLITVWSGRLKEGKKYHPFIPSVWSILCILIFINLLTVFNQSVSFIQLLFIYRGKKAKEGSNTIKWFLKIKRELNLGTHVSDLLQLHPNPAITLWTVFVFKIPDFLVFREKNWIMMTKGGSLGTRTVANQWSSEDLKQFRFWELQEFHMYFKCKLRNSQTNFHRLNYLENNISSQGFSP